MKTANISTLKIHKLTQEQYERELAAGNIDENALYFTPDESGGITEIPSEYITESELNTTLNNKLKDLSTIEVSNSQPTQENVDVWVNPTASGEFIIPEINDSTISTVDTWSSKKISDALANAGGSGGGVSSWNDLTDKPTIPTKTSQLTNDSGYLTSVPSEYITETELTAKKYLTEIPYGVCDTAADTAAKEVTVPSFELKTGAAVIVKFTNANSIASPTLNVNGTGAKPIYRYGTTAASTGTSTTGWRAGAVQMFVYDGTGWTRDFWENTTYSNVALGQGYATCSTAEATVAKVGTLSSYSLTTGGIVSVKFTHAVPASATLNINSKGAKAIYYRGSAITDGIIKAGDVATFIYSTRYHLISIDRWQNEIDSLSQEIVALDETTAKVSVEEKRVANFTNQIPISTDANGSIYNGVGYKKNAYFADDGIPKYHSTLATTGFIPCSYNTVSAFGQSVLYFDNFDSLPPSTDLRLACYDANKSIIRLEYGHGWELYDGTNTPRGAIFYKLKSDGTLDYVDLSYLTRYVHNNLGKDTAYIRICGLGIDEDTIITLNEEITYTEGVKERTLDKTLVIPQLEEVESSLETKLEELESSFEEQLEDLKENTSDIPNYIVAEAERVAKAVQSVRTSKTLVFSAMSDIHLYDENTLEQHTNSLISAKSGGMGLKEIQKRMNLDFVSLLGDYSYMSSKSYNANQVMNDITLAKKTLDVSGDKQIWCVGNHDWCYGTGVDRMLTEDELYGFVGSNSDGVKTYDSIERCFGYLDFDNQKIRVIYLNTNDCKDGIDNGATTKDNYQYMEMISPTQMRWLGDVALNFNDKEDASKWGIVILSHQPIDYGYGWYTRTLELLEAYRGSKKVTLNCSKYYLNGQWVQQSETFDFTSIEHPAEIICNVHGHIHNCASKKVSSSTSVTEWLWRFCVPNMCFGRYNEKYDSKWGEVDANGNKVEWTKELGTAKETSFNIVSIDRKNKKIYAHIFGAGKDRVFSYDSQYVPQEYTITTTLSNCTSASGNPTTITEGLSASLMFTANNGYELPTSITVSGATYAWNNTTGTLSLSNPSSNVSVTITANAIKPKYVNQLPISQEIDSTNPFNGVGYMTGKYLTSSSPYYGNGNTQEWLTGCIPYTIDKPIYIKGVSFTSASHDRMYFFSDKATRVAPAIQNGTTQLGTYFAVEQLGTNYCKLTPISGSGFASTIQWVRMGFTTGTPSEVIITVDEPIE